MLNNSCIPRVFCFVQFSISFFARHTLTMQVTSLLQLRHKVPWSVHWHFFVFANLFLVMIIIYYYRSKDYHWILFFHRRFDCINPQRSSHYFVLLPSGETWPSNKWLRYPKTFRPVQDLTCMHSSCSYYPSLFGFLLGEKFFFLMTNRPSPSKSSKLLGKLGKKEKKQKRKQFDFKKPYHLFVIS